MKKSVLFALLGLSSVEGLRVNQRSTESSSDASATAGSSGNGSNDSAFAEAANGSNGSTFAEALNGSNGSNSTLVATPVAPAMDFVRALVDVDAKQD